MSGAVSLGGSQAALPHRQDADARKPDTGAEAVAKHAMSQAQGRVDADRRAHSPSCVAVDQKGVDKASGELARVEAKAKVAAPEGQVVSMTV
jgi:hypothetical protein